MKRTLLLCAFMLLAFAYGNAQYYINQNKVWAFGNHAGVNFNTTPPTVFTSTIVTSEGSASVSNAAGSLLFYTDGKNVYDRFGTLMLHGSNIVPFGVVSTTQAAVIVPVPGNANQYYVFSLEQCCGLGRLDYSIVDMTLNSGLGDLVTGSVGIALATGLSEKMTTVAGNSCDVWLITHSASALQFFAYDITVAGISSPVSSTSGTLTGYNIGSVRVSPNRLKLACEAYLGSSGTELYDFNPTSGVVSNCQVLYTSGSQYQSEFSPDNSKLYAVQYSSFQIYQYDISLSTTADIIASRTLVGTSSGVGDLKLAADGKIYSTASGFLDCISSPNLSGTACGFISHAVTLSAGSLCNFALPNMVIVTAPNDSAYIRHDTLACFPASGNISIAAHDTGTGSGYLWNNGTTTTRTLNISTYGTYWVKIYNGCHLLIDTIHVSPLISDTVIGTTSFCAGATTLLSPSVGGGTWSSSVTSVATVNASGTVTGVAAGTATISYNLSAYCPSYTTVTVNLGPTAVTGALSVCAGVTTTLADAITGGSWSSSNTIVATVNASTGIVTAALPGTATISYSLTAGSCPPATAIFTVNPLPATITGTTHVCTGATTTLADITSGGTWGSNNTIIATINPSTGLTGGANVGVTVITYTVPNGCYNTTPITVNAAAGAISGTGSVCPGATLLLFDLPSGGIWSSGNTAIATVDATGTVTGVATGATSISYQLSTGCSATATITVNLLPAAITGVTSTCMGGTITLSDANTGGYWSSDNTVIASVDVFSGVVIASAAATGTATISYTASGGCTVTTIVTVNLGPLPIGGTLTTCAGTTTYLNDLIAGGTWSSSNTSVATVDGSGTVYGLSAGTTAISYTIGSCYATAVVTINPVPPAITGPSLICVGQPTTLHDVITGGSWSTPSSNATVDITTGVVTGGLTGVATIVYTLPTGCSISTFVTVNTSPGVIAGTAHLCPGTTTTLTDVGGGSWTSSNTAIATIGSTGVVSGITAGTANITYSLGSSCSAATTVTVNLLPPAISGILTVCAGSTTTLADGSGAWSSGSTGIATVGSATGTVSGVAGGTATITFTSATTGCINHAMVTINPLPAMPGGTLTMCPGATTLLSSSTTGGIWSSSSTGIATTGTSGTIYGVAPGTAAITYTLAITGCSRSVTVTVNTLPAIITGTLNVCAGAATTLHDATTGGVWSTASTSATVGSTSGVVSGTTGGTVTISYTAGCVRTTVITVNPTPTITGPTAECVGAVIAESASPTGGTWISTTSSVATVGSAGAVTGVATGTSSIKYTTVAGCTAQTIVTVSLSPTAILGGTTVCANDTMTLSDAVGGGVWSSNNTGVATIGSLNGIVRGVSAGTAIITYSLGTGCTVTKTISVNTAPAPITGGGSICIGATLILMDATSGGTWSSGAAGIATILSAGLVTGASMGVDTITYTHAGCFARTTITVNTTPSAITGMLHVCSGSVTVLGNAVTGGVWSSSNTGVASVDAAGNVTGALPGTATITYSLGAGCEVTKIVTVNPISVITGGTGICVGASTTLADATTGGAWSSSATTIASVNAAGIVTGNAPGTATITYTTPGGCMATTVVTVNLAPSAISGTLHVCAGATTLLGNTAGGGTWISGNTVVATISGTGTVHGIVQGTTIITYSLGSGCTVTAIVTVNTAPAAILGLTTICAGATTTLTDATTGGIWSIATATAATVSGTGTVTGIIEGTATVSYAISGCSVTAVVSVNPLPSLITGALHVCVGSVTTLGNSTTGGMWSSSNTTTATANLLTGDITGATPGTTTITYALSGGCLTTTIVTVNAAPPAITGTTGVCIGSVTSLSDPVGGGVWSSSNTAIASVSLTGLVYGTGLGTASISYTLSGCTATTIVTINSLPPAISGTPRVCAGSTTTLADIGGGTWSSGLPGIATVDGAGVVTGVSGGTAPIAYSMGAGCTVTRMVTVDAVPLPISGVTEVCLGYTTLLADASGGGTWSSSNTAMATITGAGVVSGVSGGASNISYTNSAGCSATRLVTVVAVPPILGITNMCAFSSTLPLYDSLAGGFWTSTLASVSSAGIVTPYSAGVATITYTIPLGCYTTAVLTVNPLPGPVVGLNRLCMGSTLHVSDTTTGGIWSSSNTSVAPVSVAGVVSGSAAGTATISYSVATGCATRLTVTVDVPPIAGSISGAANVCVDASIILSDVTPGGMWSSSNTAVTVLGGVVSGVSAGTSTISYTVNNSCGSVAAVKPITINPLPVAGTITGSSMVCIGDSILLSDGATGGVWSSSSTSVTIAGGMAHGVAVGVDSVKYTVTNSCGSVYTTTTVTVNALPDAGSISGIDTLCAGTTFTLLDAVTGGTWTSSNDHISVTGAGVVSAVSPGVDTITYSMTNTCGIATASITVAVKAGPLAGVIAGNTAICVGGKDTLTATLPGGTWSNSNGNVTVTSIDGGVVITGVTAGVDTIVYTITNECGAAVALLPVTICDNSGLHISGVANIEEVLQVWPNPNDGMFSVLLSSAMAEPVQLVVTNVVGEKIAVFNAVANKPTEIKLNDAAGVYFITAATTNGSYVAKVVLAW